MYIDFDQLPDEARVWVYQANRSLTNDEIGTVQKLLQSALTQWAAHGQALLASAEVVDNRFVVVGVDEGYNLPSGCSIDSSIRTLQEIGRQTGIDFFDRSAAVIAETGAVQTFALPVIKAAVTEGLIRTDMLMVNTLVKTKAEFKTNWQVPVADSWLKRYFKSVPL
jgi:hypothetical protein